MCRRHQQQHVMVAIRGRLWSLISERRYSSQPTHTHMLFVSKTFFCTRYLLVGIIYANGGPPASTHFPMALVYVCLVLGTPVVVPYSHLSPVFRFIRLPSHSASNTARHLEPVPNEKTNGILSLGFLLGSEIQSNIIHELINSVALVPLYFTN